jgi:outer membrane protein OmpA-like peptidoglycan-associated protein
MKTLNGGLLCLLGFILLACASAPKRDLDLERLRSQWQSSANTENRALASAEAMQVDDLFAQWSRAERLNKDQRAQKAYLLERRIAMFDARVDAAKSKLALQRLDKEAADIELEVAKREASTARLDAEKLRVQGLAQAEESERQAALLEAQAKEQEQITAQAELAKQQASASQELADAQAKEAELERKRAELATADANSLRLRLADIRESRKADQIVWTLGGTYFAAGQASMSAAAKEKLLLAQAALSRLQTSSIEVQGHTDNTGTAVANQKLSQKRAESVRAALIEMGLSAENISASGFGSSKPLVKNDTAVGRAANRRVEIIFHTAQ